MPERKVYLGDAVYAENNGYEIVLTTEDGISVSNRIVLEPAVVDALLKFITTKTGSVDARPANCSNRMREEGLAYPRTCLVCKLGPCPY